MASEQKTVESEVSSILWHKHELEVCKRELETYKTLYWDLQVELDRVDAMRKDMSYLALRRRKAIEKHIEENKNVKVYGYNYGCDDGGARSNKGEIESNTGYDCVGEPAVNSNSYMPQYWELQLELDKVELMRKQSIRYSALRRQKALEKLGLVFGHRKTRSESDVGCDCNGEDEID